MQDKRKPFPERPWIHGKAYDDLVRTSVMHCDVYCKVWHNEYYVVYIWRIGGFRVYSASGYLLQLDGLVPVSPEILTMCFTGRDVLWNARTAHFMKRIHKTTCEAFWNAGVPGTRRTLLCHYLRVHETDCEIQNNYWKPRRSRKLPASPFAAITLKRKPGRPRVRLPDLLNDKPAKRPRGRPAKPKLPDWL